MLIGCGNANYIFAAPDPAGAVLAFDRTTGERAWELAMPDAVLGAVAVQGHRAVCAVRNGEVVALDLRRPEVLWRSRADGSVVESIVSDKEVWVPPGKAEPCPVEESRRREPCLSAAQVGQLWQLGRRCQEHFGRPQDIEWAIQGDEREKVSGTFLPAGSGVGPGAQRPGQRWDL